jgi:hypothetical protein
MTFANFALGSAATIAAVAAGPSFPFSRFANGLKGFFAPAGEPVPVCGARGTRAADEAANGRRERMRFFIFLKVNLLRQWLNTVFCCHS